MPATSGEVISKTTEKSGTAALHVWKFKVCNTSDKPVKIKIADNPWKQPTEEGHGNLGAKLIEVLKANGERDPDKTRQKALDGWRNPDDGGTGPVTLGKKGTPSACYEFTIKYDFEPACTYADVFVEQQDSSYAFDSSGPLNTMWKDIKTAFYGPKGAAPQYVAVLPFWFPMSLEAQWGGPINVAIERIEGLPTAYEVAHTYPKLGASQRIDFGDRDSQCAIVLRQVRPVRRPATVSVYFRVRSPSRLRHWVRSISFTLVGSNPTSLRRAGDRPE